MAIKMAEVINDTMAKAKTTYNQSLDKLVREVLVPSTFMPTL